MKTKNRQIFGLTFIVLVVIFVGGVMAIQWNIFSLDSPSQNEVSQRIHGIVTQIQTGKDGVKVKLETKNDIYNMTISILQAEITGDYEQIEIGAEIKITGKLLDGMEPPLLVAEKVKVLRNQDKRK